MNQGGIQVLMDTKKTWALFFVVLLGSLLTCVSCGSIEERISDIDSRNSTGVESSQLSPDYSDKTKLVYLVPEEYKHGDKTVNAINEYLDEKGAPYYMEFQGLPNSDTNEYETMVKRERRSSFYGPIRYRLCRVGRGGGIVLSGRVSALGGGEASV